MMNFSKIPTLAQTAFSTRVIEGSRIGFIWFFMLTHASNAVVSLLPSIGKPFQDMLMKSRKTFVICNRTGVFKVRPFDDSMTISADYFEQELRPWLAKPKQKRVFIDIGANIGRYSLLAANQFGYGAVLAIEANPRTCELLRSNVALSGIKDRVTVVEKAAADAAGTVSFEVDPHHLGGGRIVDKKSGKPIWPDVTEVPADTIDAICSEARIEAGEIDFIKMDVEGHEYEALQGMGATLRGLSSGAYLMMEISDIDKEKTLALVASHGFSLVDSSANDHLFSKA